MMIKKLKNNVTVLNAFSNLLLQLTTILSGFIIPKIILNSFGSEVNGLVSSLNQFLGYISIVEGGLTNVVMASLYKPIIEKDEQKINSILKTTQKFYSKLSIIFIIYTLCLATFYPLIYQTSFSYSYVFSLALILGIGLLIQYNFSLTLRTFLNADKKIYVVSFTQIAIYFINILLFIIVDYFWPNIHLLKLITALLYLIQPIVYNKVISKNWTRDKKVKEDKNLLKNRWDGFAVSFAAFIHNNTDVIVLTTFTNLKTVSVYSVYALVTKGLSSLIKSIAGAVSPSIGQIYSRGNKEELEQKFMVYEHIVFFLSFFLFTVGGLLITPFVMLYTKGVTDVNYNQPVFGYILILAELVFCLKEPYLYLAYSANQFKALKKQAYIEAGLNIVISLVLVSKLGLIGVAIGTLIAMSFRTISQVYFLKNKILMRKVSLFFKKLLLYTIASGIGITICSFLLPIHNLSFIVWILHGIMYSVIIGLCYLVMLLLCYNKETMSIAKNLFTKKNI